MKYYENFVFGQILVSHPKGVVWDLPVNNINMRGIFKSALTKKHLQSPTKMVFHYCQLI